MSSQIKKKKLRSNRKREASKDSTNTLILYQEIMINECAVFFYKEY